MADHQRDKSTAPSSGSPPPPLDPFPTYQTPYPRSQQQDIENPFIQFRHFADAQIASLLQDFPRKFASQPSSSDQVKSDIDEMWKRRTEMEEGWKKQLEQEFEEMKQSFERRKEAEAEASRRQQVPAGWWTRGNAAKCPALNEQVTDAARNCPALYDRSGMPRTELDMYDALENQKTAAKPEGWLGYDGRKKQTASKVLSQLDQAKSDAAPPPHPNMYSRFWARRLQPVENTNHTIPWLMLSTYSPVYLCNPTQPVVSKLHIQDNPGMPLQISKPLFRDRYTTELDEKMAQQVPWADAFEDLVSLEQTGKMVEREQNNWRTPQTWIHDMVNRGSFGDRWGFNDEGQLVKKFDTTADPESNRERGIFSRRRRWRRDDQIPESRQAVTPKVVELPEHSDPSPKQVEQQDPQVPLFSVIVQNPEDVMNAINQGHRLFEEMVSKVEQQRVVEEANRPEVPEQRRPEKYRPEQQQQQLPTSAAWSTSSSSCSSHQSPDLESNSIISTMTTTDRRTLPDGSIETKRVLKQKFADGREKTNETVEVQTAPSNNTPQKYGLADYHTSIADRASQTPVQEQLRKQKGGWFWN